MSRESLLGLIAWLCSAVAGMAQPTVVNASFEVDLLPPYPGYGAISGWFAEQQTGFGLNEFNGPFADNGLIPEGRKVAFIQDAGALFQVTEGFSPGERYWLEYAENARGNCCGERVATLAVLADGVEVVPVHEVEIVGGLNEFQHMVSSVFTVSSNKVRIDFVKGGVGDSTALIDAVEVLSEQFLEVFIELVIETRFTEITVHGMPGSVVEIQGSEFLGEQTDWQRVQRVMLSAEGTGTVVDVSAMLGKTRYYRAIRSE